MKEARQRTECLVWIGGQHVGERAGADPSTQQQQVTLDLHVSSTKQRQANKVSVMCKEDAYGTARTRWSGGQWWEEGAGKEGCVDAGLGPHVTKQQAGLAAVWRHGPKACNFASPPPLANVHSNTTTTIFILSVL